MQFLYPLLPVLVAACVALRRDVYSNCDICLCHKWPFSRVLIILSGLAASQLVSYLAFKYNVISAYNLGVYGTIIFLFTAGTLAYFSVIRKFKVDRKSLGLCVGKNMNYILVPVVSFLFYATLSILYAYATDNDQIFLNWTKILHALQIFKGSVVDSAVYVVSLILIAPVIEEIIFRGIFFAPFARKLGNNGAIWMISLLWAFTHLGLNNILNIFLFGLIFGYLYKETKSLVPGIILHSLINSLPVFVYIFLQK